MDSLDKVTAFKEEIKPYCTGANIRIALEDDKPIPTLRLNAPEDRESVERILANYSDLFPYSRFELNMPFDLVSSQLSGFNFARYEALLTELIREAIQALEDLEDPIYMFSICLDPGNNGVWLGANTNAWLSDINPADEDYIWEKYFSGWQKDLDFDLSGELHELLEEHGNTIFEGLNTYGVHYISTIGPIYQQCLIEATGKALRGLLGSFQKIQLTADFVAFIRMYDEPFWISQFALRQTLDRQTIKEVFSIESPV